MYPTNQSQFLCFLVINFITKKFKIIVIGVIRIFEIIKENFEASRYINIILI